VPDSGSRNVDLLGEQCRNPGSRDEEEPRFVIGINNYWATVFAGAVS